MKPPAMDAGSIAALTRRGFRCSCLDFDIFDGLFRAGNDQLFNCCVLGALASATVARTE